MQHHDVMACRSMRHVGAEAHATLSSVVMDALNSLGPRTCSRAFKLPEGMIDKTAAAGDQPSRPSTAFRPGDVTAVGLAFEPRTTYIDVTRITHMASTYRTTQPSAIASVHKRQKEKLAKYRAFMGSSQLHSSLAVKWYVVESMGGTAPSAVDFMMRLFAFSAATGVEGSGDHHGLAANGRIPLSPQAVFHGYAGLLPRQACQLMGRKVSTLLHHCGAKALRSHLACSVKEFLARRTNRDILVSDGFVFDAPGGHSHDDGFLAGDL